MANASDIITYIGVPLAVLGVLPILYTFVLALLRQQRIRAALIHHGHKPLTTKSQRDGFTIRSSPMTSVVEIELPKYTIAPLDRHGKEYWKLSDNGKNNIEEHQRLLDRCDSTMSMIEEGRLQGFLRGGSWRAFNWKKLIVGKKLYRIQYEDELREPPAEIDFSDLVHFLLDWGAVPDSLGWEKLRTGGLWTPAGTVLLRNQSPQDDNPKHVGEWVLRTSMPDDSDGILTMCVRWPDQSQDLENIRGAGSLPPGWGRLYQPQAPQVQEKGEPETDTGTGTGQTRRTLPQRIEENKSSSKHQFDDQSGNSIRFRVDGGVVTQVLWECDHFETGFGSDLFHLTKYELGRDLFTCAASAVILKRASGGNLWSSNVSPEVSAFARRDSIPCGVLVLLDIIDKGAAPDWTTGDDALESARHFATFSTNQFRARMAADQIEKTMPPEQARMHRMNCEDKWRQERIDDMMAQHEVRRKREETRTRDAIASARMGNKAVAEACLAWLIAQGEIDSAWTIEQVVEALLMLFVVDERDQGEAAEIMQVLHEWMNWAVAGGMKKQHLETLRARKMQFCYAVCLVALIQESCLQHETKSGLDMQECLQLWKKVRLG